MRVPIAALPFHYILDLSKKSNDLVETGLSSFSATDLKLMRHWEKLAEQGIDPVFINSKLEKETQIFTDESTKHFDVYLRPYFDTLRAQHTAAQPGQTPQPKSPLT